MPEHSNASGSDSVHTTAPARDTEHNAPFLSVAEAWPQH